MKTKWIEQNRANESLLYLQVANLLHPRKHETIVKQISLIFNSHLRAQTIVRPPHESEKKNASHKISIIKFYNYVNDKMKLHYKSFYYHHYY